MRLIGGFWPAGVDPLTVGFAITSLAIAMVVTVAVAKLPSQGSTPALQLTVDEYVRLTALVASARTVSTVGGGIIWLLVPVLATGDAYPKFCCVIFVLLGLLCFRLAATLPVPVSYWEADQEEMQALLGRVRRESARIRASRLRADQDVSLARVWFIAVLLWGVVTASIITLLPFQAAALALGRTLELSQWISLAPFALAAHGLVVACATAVRWIWPIPLYCDKEVARAYSVLCVLCVSVVLVVGVSVSLHLVVTISLVCFVASFAVSLGVPFVALPRLSAWASLRLSALERREARLQVLLEESATYVQARKMLYGSNSPASGAVDVVSSDEVRWPFTS